MAWVNKRRWSRSMDLSAAAFLLSPLGSYTLDHAFAFKFLMLKISFLMCAIFPSSVPTYWICLIVSPDGSLNKGSHGHLFWVCAH